MTVRSVDASGVTFSLDVSNNFGSFNTGTLEPSKAAPSGSSRVFSDATLNCRLELTPTERGIDVTQRGPCGFGLNVFADRRYVKE